MLRFDAVEIRLQVAGFPTNQPAIEANRRRKLTARHQPPQRAGGDGEPVRHFLRGKKVFGERNLGDIPGWHTRLSRITPTAFLGHPNYCTHIHYDGGKQEIKVVR
jgi:hypothetical protein